MHILKRAWSGWQRIIRCLGNLQATALMVLLACGAIIGINVLLVNLTGGYAVPSPDDTYLNRTKYIAMAQAPFSDDDMVHWEPVAWRVVTPWLVHSLPFDNAVGFQITTLTGLTTALLFTYLYLRRLFYSVSFAILGIALLGMVPAAFRSNVWDYFLADPLALASVAMAFYFMEARRDFALAALLPIAVANKETLLAVVPVFIVMRLRERGLTVGFAYIVSLVCIPALLTYLALRLTIDVTNPHDLLILASSMLHKRFIEDGVYGAARQLYLLSFGTWGVILPLLLAFPRANLRYLLHRPEWVLFTAFIYAQLVIAIDDERLFVYAFPVVLPLAINTIKLLSIRISRPSFAILVASFVGVQFAFVMNEDMSVETKVMFAIGMTAIWPLLALLAKAKTATV